MRGRRAFADGGSVPRRRHVPQGRHVEADRARRHMGPQTIRAARFPDRPQFGQPHTSEGG